MPAGNIPGTPKNLFSISSLLVLLPYPAIIRPNTNIPNSASAITSTMTAFSKQLKIQRFKYAFLRLLANSLFFSFAMLVHLLIRLSGFIPIKAKFSHSTVKFFFQKSLKLLLGNTILRNFFPIDSYHAYYLYFLHLHHLSKLYVLLFVLVALSLQISYNLITEYQSE